jgi:hypothetical protein
LHKNWKSVIVCDTLLVDASPQGSRSGEKVFNPVRSGEKKFSKKDKSHLTKNGEK